jgi:hypothetical protein
MNVRICLMVVPPQTVVADAGTSFAIQCCGAQCLPVYACRVFSEEYGVVSTVVNRYLEYPMDKIQHGAIFVMPDNAVYVALAVVAI